MPQDSFEIIFNSILEELADLYLPGTFDFLEKYRPKLYEEIFLAEDTLNRDWKKRWIVAFKIDIKNWQDLIKRGIEEFQHEQMHLSKQRKPSKKPKARTVKSKSQTKAEVQRTKSFWDVFQEMQDKGKNA